MDEQKENAVTTIGKLNSAHNYWLEKENKSLSGLSTEILNCGTNCFTMLRLNDWHRNVRISGTVPAMLAMPERMKATLSYWMGNTFYVNGEECPKEQIWRFENGELKKVPYTKCE